MRLFTAIAFTLASLPAAAQDIDEGSAAFAAHCAGCHGANAKGDGPMAKLLTVPPADLTGIAARSDGVFPTARVIQRIDGTTEVLAHGGPMPVFGAMFRGDTVAADAPDGSPVITSRRVLAVVDYLISIQN